MNMPVGRMREMAVLLENDPIRLTQPDRIVLKLEW